MTFEDEFPSFNTMPAALPAGHCKGCKPVVNNCRGAYTREEIMERCKDNQRIKKAIEQVASHGEGCRCPVRMNDFAKQELMRLLDL